MNKLHFPLVTLPKEFVVLLKTNLSLVSQSSIVFDTIKTNKALYMICEQALAEFDENQRGLENIITVLGWSNFRDRMASIFISKKLYGNFPTKTNMELVDDIKTIETKFSDHGVNSFSRAFLLGFYLKMANIELHERESEQQRQILIPDEIGTLLKLSHGRSEKIDWLVIIVLHLQRSFGPKSLMNHIGSARKLNELYPLMSPESREMMHENLLAYGASINESELFLYEKI